MRREEHENEKKTDSQVQKIKQHEKLTATHQSKGTKRWINK